MEEAHSIGERVLDEHSPGIAGDDVAGSGACVIGEQDRGLVVAEIFDEELPERMLARANLLLIDLVPQADAGKRSISVSRFGERRRKVMKVIPAASSRSRPS